MLESEVDVASHIPEETPLSRDPVLQLLQQHGELGVSEIAELGGMSRSTASRRLNDLLLANLVTSKGKARATRYFLKQSQQTEKA